MCYEIDGPTCCTHAQPVIFDRLRRLIGARVWTENRCKAGPFCLSIRRWIGSQSLMRGSLQPMSCICSLCTLQRSTADPGPLAHFQVPKRASADIEFLATCVCWEHSTPCLEKRLPAPAKKLGKQRQNGVGLWAGCSNNLFGTNRQQTARPPPDKGALCWGVLQGDWRIIEQIAIPMHPWHPCNEYKIIHLSGKLCLCHCPCRQVGQDSAGVLRS